MRFQSFLFAAIGLLGLGSFPSAPSFAAGFRACYALQNGNEDRVPRIPLDQVCLSDDGSASLHGPGGFDYDFHVQAEFHPSAYGCHVNRHTGDEHCGYSEPLIRFSGGDGWASIEADIETRQPAVAIHSSSFVWLDIDRYVFDPFHPLQAQWAVKSFRGNCDPATSPAPCHPCSCIDAGGSECSSWPPHCK